MFLEIVPRSVWVENGTMIFAALTALFAGYKGWLAWLQADIEKSQQKIDADVKKHQITVEGEVAKAKEKSVGSEAILKIWNKMDEFQEHLDKYYEMQASDHTNDILMNEIVKRLQEDCRGLTKLIFENFSKR